MIVNLAPGPLVNLAKTLPVITGSDVQPELPTLQLILVTVHAVNVRAASVEIANGSVTPVPPAAAPVSSADEQAMVTG